MRSEIGRRLKDLRVAKGLTQKGLASRVSGGLDYTYIGKIERGEQLPSLKILLGISQALGVPVGHFFREEAAAAGEILPADLRALLVQEKGRELIQALRLLHPADLPLITEIAQVLNRHRAGARDPRRTPGDLLRAAEEEPPYEKS